MGFGSVATKSCDFFFLRLSCNKFCSEFPPEKDPIDVVSRQNVPTEALRQAIEEARPG